MRARYPPCPLRVAAHRPSVITSRRVSSLTTTSDRLSAIIIPGAQAARSIRCSIIPFSGMPRRALGLGRSSLQPRWWRCWRLVLGSPPVPGLAGLRGCDSLDRVISCSMQGVPDSGVTLIPARRCHRIPDPPLDRGSRSWMFQEFFFFSQFVVGDRIDAVWEKPPGDGRHSCCKWSRPTHARGCSRGLLVPKEGRDIDNTIMIWSKPWCSTSGSSGSHVGVPA